MCNLSQGVLELGLKRGHAEGWEEGHEKGRAEGREEGRAEGREEGRAEGILATIEAYREMGLPDSEILNRIVKKFSLAKQEATAYLEKASKIL